MSNIRITPDRIFCRYQSSQFRQGHLYLRPEDHTAQPCRLVLLHYIDKSLHPALTAFFPVKALRRYPYLCIRMILVQILLLLFQERQQYRRMSITRITARHKDHVDLWKQAENLAPLGHSRIHGRLVSVVVVDRREPYPQVEPVIFRQLRHQHHHLQLRLWQMWAIVVVITPRRNQLQRIHPENHHVTVILLPYPHVPRIIRIRLGPVTQLMASQGDLRGGCDTCFTAQ